MASPQDKRRLTDGGTDESLALGEVVHTTTTVDVRDGPGVDEPITDAKRPGTRGTVVGGPRDVGGFDWVQVEFDDDRLAGDDPGWVTTAADAVARGGDPPQRFGLHDAVHATDYVNVRLAPGTDAEDIGTAGPDDAGTVTAGPRDADGYTWWRVEFDHTPDGWVADDWLAPGSLAGCDPDWDTGRNREALARLLTSEASVGSDAEQRAVGYTVLNRMDRNGTDAVRDEWDAYAHGQEPTDDLRDLAGRILRCEADDPSGGATHFYSPVSMPHEGDNTAGYDVGGGLEDTPGLDDRNYAPSWVDTHYRCYVDGARQAYYKFYRPSGFGPV